MKTAAGLAAVLAALAARLPEHQVEVLANAIEQLPGPDPAAVEVLHRLVPTEPFRAGVTELARAWQSQSHLDGTAMALALRSACVANSEAADRARVEVVWTGPDGDVDVRLTYAVLIEVIHEATDTLTLLSFAAHKVDEVAQALVDATNRGVMVRLILDSGTAAERAFTTVRGITVYTWPPTLLAEHDPAHASMHAKAAIADRRVAFVTSANLTGYALERNMELGLVVRGGEVPELLADHFGGLIARGVLVEV